jgi:Tfp pilus assembly protein PilN
MTQVNLLPPEVRERHKIRRQVGLVAVAGVAVLGLLVLLFLVQSRRLSSAQHDLEAQQGRNAALQGQISQLQQFAQLKQQLADREALVASLFQQQILWSSVLTDISDVIPSQMWLTSLSGTVSGAPGPEGGASTPSTGTGEIVATVQFQGMAFDHPTVALWLTRLEEVTGWVNSWITQATKSVDTTTGATSVNFSGSVDLTAAAASPGRQQ